ncbi:hypothetical protein [Notoacmeibacter sp. MSK16QG-6]|uniref:hypothetical protein n=1 Tax=Notoacmeibacter sp. MSK16QG-6 TaxID=2957982 RepID=UPI0020A03B19|nr:hypothetical protein [Notoacmeibacter sp. MSK16QG-6]MCP1199849.1 hypothetical protein [Notoacmeibacter sp. MSK16QG-6]
MTPKDAKDSDEENDEETVASGQYASVILLGEAATEWRQLVERATSNADTTSVREERALRRYFNRYAELGRTSLDEKMFKPQTRISTSSGAKVQVYEFKAYQFRIYGCETARAGHRCFVGTSCDPKKKKDKADPRRLKRAAEKFVEIENERERKENERGFRQGGGRRAH